MIIPNYDLSDSVTDSVDYKTLYQLELKKNIELENELQIADNQLKMYTKELSQAFIHSKHNRKQLASANSQLVKYASDLKITFSSLKLAHKELQSAYKDTVFRLVLASEYKDKDTGNHIKRMSRFSAHLAHLLGLPAKEIDSITYAAPMHDVGKIGIPDNILLKSGMLTESEFSIIKTHTTIGSVILENSRSNVLQIAQTIALSHHEYWNGDGYPCGLQKDNIPLSARIVAISDTFDALTSKRPYKSPYPIDVACEIIKKERARHFDPDLVDALVNHIDEFAKIKHDIDNTDPYETSEFAYSERDLVLM
ncbi:MAG: HD domain-containing protein [Fibrobacter sp.]|nr:HD domain-containing protein [Fibrobacter sp.]